MAPKKLNETATETSAPAEASAFPFALPKIEGLNFDAASMEVPAAVRDIAQKGVEQAKLAYEKAKASTSEASAALEESIGTCTKGASELSGKVMANVQANASSVLDFAQAFFSAKTVAEAVELQTAFARKQFEVLSTQGKDLQAATQKFVTDVSAPVKAAGEKAFAELKKSA